MRISRYPVVVCGLLTVAGCKSVPFAGQMAGAAIQTVRGCQAEGRVITGCTPATLARYRSLRPGQVTTDVPPIVAPEVLREVERSVRKELSGERTSRLFPGGPPVLVFDVCCRFFKQKSLIGGESRLDWLVNLRDGETDAPIGVIHIEGLSQSPIEHGADDLAEENTKELLKVFERLMVGRK